MSELTEFLLARIAEDERHAHKLAETDLRPVLSLATTVNHPARVLRECEAKRRIVERCSKYDPSWHSDMELADVAEVMEDTLYDLAAVYADHPDYRDEWKP